MCSCISVNLAVADVSIPLSVMAPAIAAFPLLTDRKSSDIPPSTVLDVKLPLANFTCVASKLSNLVFKLVTIVFTGPTVVFNTLSTYFLLTIEYSEVGSNIVISWPSIVSPLFLTAVLTAVSAVPAACTALSISSYNLPVVLNSPCNKATNLLYVVTILLNSAFTSSALAIIFCCILSSRCLVIDG